MESSSSKSYPHELLPNSSIYRFTTSKGIVYEAYFAEGGSQFPRTSFAADAVLFNVAPAADSQEPGGLDSRVGATIVDIVASQFADNPQAVVCYVCDQADARAFKRAMRFARLFEQGNTEQQLEKADVEVPPLYASILFRRDHPARVEIEQAVQELVGKFLDEDEEE